MNNFKTFKFDRKRTLTVVLLAAVIALCLVCVVSCDDPLFSNLKGITAEYKGGDVEVGGTLNKDDVTVTARYRFNKYQVVTDFSLEYDFSTAGQREVIVIYEPLFTTFTVNVVEKSVDPEPPVTLASITAVYNGDNIEVGGELNISDVVVTAYYSNDTSKTVTDFTVDGFSSETAGEKQVSVTYIENDVTKTCTFTISVVEPEPPKPTVTLESITAVYNGDNIKVGGTLNNDDIVVTAIYSDETSNTVANFAVSGFSSATAGTCVVAVSYAENGVSKETTVSITIIDDSQPIISNSNVSIHFLELGNKYVGDSVYIKAGENDILIDAGSRESSAGTIYNYIKDYVTDGKLEYVIATHAHQDHIAGFVGTNAYPSIFEKFKVDTLIDFALTNQNLKTDKGNDTLYGKYVNKRAAVIQKGASHYTAAECFEESVEGAKRVYELGSDVTLEILYNYYYFNKSSDENNYSVSCILHQGNNHYFFSGDLEKEGEEKLVDYYNSNHNPLPHCTLYKAGHHGSKTSSTAKLMAAISPEYVCVCCCAGTSEYTAASENQFPTQDFINRVAPYTDKVYVTTMVDNYVSTGWASNGTVKSMNGNITFSCLSGEISINGSNNNLKLKDTEWFKTNRTCPKEWETTSD